MAGFLVSMENVGAFEELAEPFVHFSYLFLCVRIALDRRIFPDRFLDMISDLVEFVEIKVFDLLHNGRSLRLFFQRFFVGIYHALEAFKSHSFVFND